MGQPPVETVKAEGAEQKTEIGYKPDMGEDLGKGATLNVHFLIHSRISGINLDVY